MPNSFTGKLIQYKQFDKYTKNCYRIVHRSVRRKKNKNLIKERCYRGEEIGRKKRREVDREKSVGREEAKGGDSESVRREKKQREEKK